MSKSGIFLIIIGAVIITILVQPLKRDYLQKMPRIASDIELLVLTQKYDRVTMSFPDGDKEYRIITPAYDERVAIAYMHDEEIDKWEKIDVPLSKPYYVEELWGIATNKENIWLQVKDLYQDVTNVYVYKYNLRKKKFTLLSSDIRK